MLRINISVLSSNFYFGVQLIRTSSSQMNNNKSNKHKKTYASLKPSLFYGIWEVLPWLPHICKIWKAIDRNIDERELHQFVNIFSTILLCLVTRRLYPAISGTLWSLFGFKRKEEKRLALISVLDHIKSWSPEQIARVMLIPVNMTISEEKPYNYAHKEESAIRRVKCGVRGYVYNSLSCYQNYCTYVCSELFKLLLR